MKIRLIEMACGILFSLTVLGFGGVGMTAISKTPETGIERFDGVADETWTDRAQTVEMDDLEREIWEIQQERIEIEKQQAQILTRLSDLDGGECVDRRGN